MNGGGTERTPHTGGATEGNGRRPDVLLIMFDDIGFSDLGCYGSEIDTPNLDALAAGGHRYNNFHATTLCSPSRACLLSGRNHHAVGMRMLTGTRYDYPSGQERITRRAALISEVLRESGWNTFAAGKWHVLPQDNQGPAGPYDDWPLRRGFNRFYGFLGGAADHYYPELVRDNHHIEPPARPEDGYHLTDDLIDHSSRFVSDHIAHRPWDPLFLYLPLGAAHAPHHAPPHYMERVRGRFDAGYDRIREKRYERQLEAGIIPPGTALPPSNPDVRPWASLTAEERLVSARLQEAYAAFIEHTDTALGRLFDHLKRVGRWDNTLIFVCSDNGAAMDGRDIGAFGRIHFFNDIEPGAADIIDRIDEIGGPTADSQYARGWAQASNTPLKWYKRYTHGGGIRVPLIVKWGDRTASPGAMLDQFHHLIDIAPTIYEVAGVEPPAEYQGRSQLPIHGRSMAYTFGDPTAPSRKGPQYFEMTGHRGIWADGWKAVTRHTPGDPYATEEWELYHLDEDFSEFTDLAASEPEKLAELDRLFWREAEANDVLPLDDRYMELFWSYSMDERSPLYRRRVDYYPPLSHVERAATPPIEHCSYQIEAVASGEMEGVIVAYGHPTSGFVLYVKDGRLHYEYNAAGPVITHSISLPDDDPLTVGFDFDLLGERAGRGRLSAGDHQGEWFNFDRVLIWISLAGMDVGRDEYGPISTRYEAPFPFRGELRRVTFHLGSEIKGPRRRDDY